MAADTVKFQVGWHRSRLGRLVLLALALSCVGCGSNPSDSGTDVSPISSTRISTSVSYADALENARRSHGSFISVAVIHGLPGVGDSNRAREVLAELSVQPTETDSWVVVKVTANGLSVIISQEHEIVGVLAMGARSLMTERSARVIFSDVPFGPREYEDTLYELQMALDAVAVHHSADNIAFDSSIAIIINGRHNDVEVRDQVFLNEGGEGPLVTVAELLAIVYELAFPNVYD